MPIPRHADRKLHDREEAERERLKAEGLRLLHGYGMAERGKPKHKEETSGGKPELHTVSPEVPVVISAKVETDTADKPVAKVERLEDWGEKIGGAKKDLATELSSITSADIANKPLSKTFPEPHYSELVANGILTDKGAIILKFLYDNIPAKPRKPYRVAGWAAKVQSCIDAYKDIIRPDSGIGVEKLWDVMIKADKFGNDFSMFAETMKGLGFPKEDVKLGNYKIRRFFGSGRISIVNGQFIIKDYPTIHEAIEGLKAILNRAETKMEGTKFSVYQDRRSKEFFIGKKGAIDVVRVMQNFKTSKEAFDYLKDHKAELQAIWDGMKLTPEERRKENRDRVGIDYRHGHNISTEEFGKAFGFRGVEFGKWENNSDRQRNINDAYDSLMDLAGILKVPPHVLSLNGELGFAFGARGSGRASAHYEPGKVVINLTKTRGAGSLAHEWWHSLDNYFSRKRGLKENYITENPRQRVTREGKMDESVRLEILDAYKAIIQAIEKTKLRERSSVLDSTRSKEYWSTAVEMSARCFEDYVINKLQQANQRNDYLANLKGTSEWISDMKGAIEPLKNYPYPLADESPVINQAYQQFFEVLKEEDLKHKS